MLKLYGWVCAFIVVLVGMVGFVLPFLYSAGNTSVVLFGVLCTFLMIPVLFWIGKRIWKSPEIQSFFNPKG